MRTAPLGFHLLLEALSSVPGLQVHVGQFQDVGHRRKEPAQLVMFGRSPHMTEQGFLWIEMRGTGLKPQPCISHSERNSHHWLPLKALGE